MEGLLLAWGHVLPPPSSGTPNDINSIARDTKNTSAQEKGFGLGICTNVVHNVMQTEHL